MTYLCDPVPQYDAPPGGGPTRFWASNCGCASCAELIDLASVGAKRLTSAAIRNTTGDVSGGIEGAVLRAAANELSSNLYPLEYIRATSRAEVRDIWEQSSTGIIINCKKTINTPYRTNWFTGLHWVTVAAGTHRDKDGTDKVEDPGTTRAGWNRWPRGLILDAAWAAAENGYWLLVAPPTEHVAKHGTTRAAIRERPTNDSRRVGRLDRGDRQKVRRTLRGGPWKRANRTTAFGWHEIEFGGGVAYVRGEALR